MELSRRMLARATLGLTASLRIGGSAEAAPRAVPAPVDGRRSPRIPFQVEVGDYRSPTCALPVTNSLTEHERREKFRQAIQASLREDVSPMSLERELDLRLRMLFGDLSGRSAGSTVPLAEMRAPSLPVPVTGRVPALPASTSLLASPGQPVPATSKPPEGEMPPRPGGPLGETGIPS